MRSLGAFLIASFAALLLARTAVAQDALPQFSDPYGGAQAYTHTDAPPPPPATPKPNKKSAAKKPAPKPADIPAGTSALTQPNEPASHPVTLSPPASRTEPKDSALGFDLKWSAANNPYYSPQTSTIPNVDAIKRNANDTPVETGSSVEAGVKLKF
jgi:hypothetical protein